MNIFVHEFKAKFKSMLIWSASLIGLLLLFMSIAKGFSASSLLFNEMIANFPQQLLMAFGMQNFNFDSILGFFGLVFLFVQICLAIQAANYGFGLVSIEENEFTADFLLPKPISRPRIMTAKFLAALANLTLTNLILWIVTFVVLTIFKYGPDYEIKRVIVLLSSILPFQLVFMSLGMVISLMVKRVRNVTPFSMGLVFGLYILNVFGDMIGKKGLEVITPFQHFDPSYIITNLAYDPLVWISLTATVISLVGSYILYARRNIPSAV